MNAQKTQRFMPALKYRVFTRFYDTLVRFTTKESMFKAALVTQSLLLSTEHLLDIHLRKSMNRKTCQSIFMLLTVIIQSFSTAAGAGCNNNEASRALVCSSSFVQEQSANNSDVNSPWTICIDTFACSHYCHCHFAMSEMSMASLYVNAICDQKLIAHIHVYQSPYHSALFRPPIV